jgi:hypothetical protein
MRNMFGYLAMCFLGCLRLCFAAQVFRKGPKSPSNRIAYGSGIKCPETDRRGLLHCVNICILNDKVECILRKRKR